MIFAFYNYIEFSTKDIKETVCHRQTIGKTENEKQYFPTENSFQGRVTNVDHLLLMSIYFLF